MVGAILPASHKEAAMIDIANGRSCGVHRRLPMATDAQHRLICNEHFVKDRTVRVVTHLTAIAHRVVREHKWASYALVALKAHISRTLIRHSRPRHDVLVVRRVAVGALHPFLRDRMMILKLKFDSLVDVAGKTPVGGISYDLLRVAA